MPSKKPAIQRGQGHPTGIIDDTAKAFGKAVKNAKTTIARKTAAKSLTLDSSGTISRKAKSTRMQTAADRYLQKEFSVKGVPNSYSITKDPYVGGEVLKTRPSKRMIKEHKKSMRSLEKGKTKLQKTLQKTDKKLQKDLKKIDKRYRPR